MTMIDFIINAAHNTPECIALKERFIESLKKAATLKDIEDFFIAEKYEVTKDELFRIYENKDRIYSNIELRNY
ncbi:MAG: hypothetical protein JXA20_01835 [Spirochaetes bacterium]|nr:hypothetical protein [Spirochaetota bacterium]